MSKKVIQENYMRMKLLENQLNAAFQEKSVIEELIEGARNTLEALSELEGGKETVAFFSLGSNVFIGAEIRDPGKIYINSGAGIIAMKTAKEAYDIISERMKNSEESLKEIEQNIKYMTEEIRLIEEKMNLLSSGMGA